MVSAAVINYFWPLKCSIINNTTYITYKEIFILRCHFGTDPEVVTHILAPKDQNVAPLLLARLNVE